MRDKLLAMVDGDRDRIIKFVRDMVRAKSPNPPGDTTAVMRFIRDFLDAEGVAYEIIQRDETMPNLVSSTEFGPGEKHLVLNGHIDVFPVENPQDWKHDPWGGEVADGAIFGRGVADMKVGTTASILTYYYLTRLQPRLKGRLTLTVVSEEENFGPNGARHLFDVCPERITGTACLIGEPSGKHTVRFGEKGCIWIRFTITTPGGHGAYPHQGPNAVDLACALMADLRKFTTFEFQEPQEVVQAIEASRDAFDKANGEGASDNVRKIFMNVGTMKAGPKVNMIASHCEFEADIRIPNGVTTQDFLDHVESLRKTHSFEHELLCVNEPNWVEPNSELIEIVSRNAVSLNGILPMRVVGLGSCDGRLWRYAGVPAVVYGPAPKGMGGIDEMVPVDEMLDVVRCHLLSAYDYLVV